MSTDGLFSSRFASRFAIADRGISEEKQCVSSRESEDSANGWSLSYSKRFFDIACVLLATPLVLPVCLCIAAAVRLTSHGPALFKQGRAGLGGITFTIFKFRTMEHEAIHKAEAALNQGFTRIGPFLRRWKLDELPQLLNVLIGDMSLVGPRPKLPEHQLGTPRYRPGITGAATLVFANEEAVLAHIPQDRLKEYFRTIVLPAKLRLDQEYMVGSTFASDLAMIIRTLLRRWDRNRIFHLLGIEHPQTAHTRHRDPQCSCSVFEFAAEEGSSGD